MSFSVYLEILLLAFWLHLTNYLCVAIVCYKCDSLTLESCATTLDETVLPYEDCKTSLQCVMSIVDSITYRGCGANTPTLGATYKKTCPDNLCNKGVYPPGRLKCYQCADGMECVNKQIGKPHPCLYHNEIDQCYTEVRSETEVYRGCATDRNHTIRGDAEYCEVNGCNANTAAVPLRCAVCDSNVERGCKMDLFEVNTNSCNITKYETCEVFSLLTHEETCFKYKHLNRVVRGCTKDMPHDLKADITHVEQCSNLDYCNAKCVEQQKCLVCDTATNQNCRGNVGDIILSTCSSAQQSSCYACKHSDWREERGCGKPPTITSTSNCYECETTRCNAVPFNSCYKCTTAKNPNCATWERPGYIEIEECSTPGAACIIATFKNGTTQRGCESAQLSCNDTLLNCQNCNGSFCNKNVYPAHSLRCYQCAGANCDFVDVEPKDPLPCPPWPMTPVNETEYCFSFLDPVVGMIRGCKSNTTQYIDCMVRGQGLKGCKVCLTDGCNNLPATHKPTLQCYQCEANDFNCQAQQLTARYLQQCTEMVNFGEEESCFTAYYFDGTITRGCTLDHEKEITAKRTPAGVVYCSSGACNSAEAAAHFCVTCQAVNLRNATDDCISQPQRLVPQMCSNNTKSCYTLITDSQLVRGCSNNLPFSLLMKTNYCHSKSNSKCRICEQHICSINNYFETNDIEVMRRNHHSSSPNGTKQIIWYLLLLLIFNSSTFYY
ncbi:uncharacterized protein LOC119687803 [Teleopsis dalmanni]|uniref:uncharacterized protein LOC119687803 n=1 Tax=Teleopsis dalmanni TaxID=139649 RepID=UPI0018CF8381|nr:uncharacterized protein LOC119687803 [Teleopsis dalmanni]